MPGFIRNKGDEKRWAEAKQAANKTHSESEGDSYWAVVNSIYQKMSKAKEELEKARRRLSDEYDPNDMGDDVQSEEDELGEGYRELDPDTEDDEAAKWLQENDPESQGGAKYDEYGEDEDEDAHQSDVEDDLGSDDIRPQMDLADEEGRGEAPAAAAQQAAAAQAQPQAAPQEKRASRWNQPSREELTALRAYTRPWEQRAREAAALKADPSKNPELARHGNIIEARNKAHADRNAAYRALTSSDEYKNADPIQQMEMDDNFEKDWHSKNADYLKNAMTSHAEAHQKGKGARDIHAAAKDAQIKNILSGGGHGGEGYSLEEGMQHAGGVKGEEGTQATVKQDPASSFAMGNQDFIREYAKQYADKGKKVSNIDEMGDYNEGSQRDISRILGEGPAKDPKFEQFFQHYYPLIGMNAKKTLARLGIDANHPDVDMSMLHEAGMHGLIQAMNDYDHDNPGKASFATHAANKIRGLQMTAMKNQDAIPTEVRQAQKKFASQGAKVAPATAAAPAAPEPAASAAPKVDLNKLIAHPKNPNAPDMVDRLKRVSAARSAHNTVKIRKGPGNTGGTGGMPGGQGGGL